MVANPELLLEGETVITKAIDALQPSRNKSERASCWPKVASS